MTPKKDQYMRGYSDGFKDGAEAKGKEAHALAAKLAETEGMRDHYLSMWKEASAGQDAEERERVEILEIFHKEVWIWLLKRGLVDNDDDEWRGFVDVIEEHESEIEAGATRAAARIAEAAYEDAPSGSYDNGGTQDGWQMACQEIVKRITAWRLEGGDQNKEITSEAIENQGVEVVIMTTNGFTCDNCGSGLVDQCYRCGAPQCCPRCCVEATASTLSEIKGPTFRRQSRPDEVSILEQAAFRDARTRPLHSFQEHSVNEASRRDRLIAELLKPECGATIGDVLANYRKIRRLLQEDAEALASPKPEVHGHRPDDTNELEAARVLSQEGGIPVSAAVELARAASDLLATTTDERQVPSIWLPRVDRLRAAIAKATS